MSLPYVSVIMPIRNEAVFIERSLRAVLAQDYPHDRLEILVADGMSDDNTKQIVQHIASNSDISITIVDNPRRIVPTGFNIAFHIAKGDIIIRVDGHCEIAQDYIIQCVRHLQMRDVAGVGGPIETISQNLIGETIAVGMSSSFGVGGSAFRTQKDKTTYVDTIPFPAYWREAVDKVGLLDEDMVRNQDDEYNYRLRSNGYRLLLTPDIKSRYYSRASLWKLWKQYYQYGVYKVRVLQKHPSQMRLRQFVPPIFVLTVLGGAVLAPFSVTIRWLWFLVIITYAIANTSASIWTARKTGWRHLLLLPIVFATLHFAYGVGFLWGLVKFRSRWIC